jgi:hypothetical protein
VRHQPFSTNTNANKISRRDVVDTLRRRTAQNWVQGLVTEAALLEWAMSQS